ncbi:MAG: MCE family protein [Bdellovibrionales bacterium]|nr:MCE family protein [Bdellovibrionales bacterium]
MENTNSNNLRVGIFVTIGLVIFMISVVLIGGDKVFFKKYNSYSIYIKQTQGLLPGSVVSLSGINIGNIKEIRFRDLSQASESSKNLPLEIVIDVVSDFSTQITKNASVSIKTQGALGDKFVYIVPGEPGSEILPVGGVLMNVDSSDFLDALSERSDDISKIGDVIAELHKLLVNINADGRSASIVTNLDSATKKIDLLISDLRQLTSDVRGTKDEGLKSTIVKLNSILTKIDNGKGSLGALINDPILHDKLSKLLGESPRKKFLKPIIRETIKTNDHYQE